MSQDQVSNGFANAVDSARVSTLRVKSGRCSSTSGTAFSEDLLLTTQHALRNTQEAAVFDETGTERKAELVGVDAGTDLALLRVEGGGLRAPSFAGHDALRVGDMVLALGRPGVAIRASLRMLGLLSAELRTPSGGRLERYIESDRGLPDGFEGGPLVNPRGEVIGINTSTLLRGADLTVPHATLARVVSELVAHGRMRRGYLGVATQPVRLPTALREALSQRSGALVLDTDSEGPAHKAGLGMGDVIVAVDDKPVRGPRELSAALSDKIGAAVALRIVRGGKLETVQVTIGERA